VGVYYTTAAGFEWSIRCSDCESHCLFLPQWSVVLPSVVSRTVELLKHLFGLVWPEQGLAASESPRSSASRSITLDTKVLRFSDPDRPLFEAISLEPSSESSMLDTVRGTSPLLLRVSFAAGNYSHQLWVYNPAELLSLDRRDLLYKEIFSARSKDLRRAVDDESCMVLLASRGLSKTKLKRSSTCVLLVAYVVFESLVSLLNVGFLHNSILYHEHLHKWTAKAVRRYLSDPRSVHAVTTWKALRALTRVRVFPCVGGRFANLAITGGDGSVCPEDGLYLPALSPKGLIAGGQIKPFVVQADRPRYCWNHHHTCVLN
jgi:hypothetical protein